MARNLLLELGGGGSNNREFVRKRVGVRKKRACTYDGVTFKGSHSQNNYLSYSCFISFYLFAYCFLLINFALLTY